MYWRQRLEDDKDAVTPTIEQMQADGYASNTALKHYDYAGSRTVTADVDSLAAITTADQNMNSATYNGDDDNYGWMLRSSYRNALFQLKVKKVSGEQRKQICRYLRESSAETPLRDLLKGSGIFLRLFLKTGINLLPVREKTSRLCEKTGINVMSCYFARRDRRSVFRASN